MAETTKIWRLQAVARLQVVWIIGSVHGPGNCGVPLRLRLNSFDRSKQVSSFEVPAMASAIASALRMSVQRRSMRFLHAECQGLKVRFEERVREADDAKNSG